MDRYSTWIPRTASIHVPNYSLLVFHLYRPFLLGVVGEDRDGNARLWEGDEGWVRGRWACSCLPNMAKHHSWENILPGCFPYCICTFGTRVADMLVRSSELHLPFHSSSRHQLL